MFEIGNAVRRHYHPDVIGQVQRITAHERIVVIWPTGLVSHYHPHDLILAGQSIVIMAKAHGGEPHVMGVGVSTVAATFPSVGVEIHEMSRGGFSAYRDGERLGTSRRFGDVIAFCGLDSLPAFYVHPDRERFTMTPCQSCPDLIDSRETDNTVCDDCRVSCGRCSDVVSRDEMHTVSVAWRREEEWCQDCYGLFTYSCEHSCGASWPLDREGYGGHCDGCGIVCESCYDDVPYCDHCEVASCGDHDDCGGSADVYGLHSYGYKPSPQFRSTPEEKAQGWAHAYARPYFGLELEIDAQDGHTRLIDESATGDLCYLKEDGTVDGFEIVTHPMTHDWFLANFPFAKLRELYHDGARPGNNGLHVHVSRDAFADSAHLYRFLRLIYGNQGPVQSFSRRESSYARFDDEGTLPYKARTVGCGERYEAVNCQNYGTIEVRLFRSTLNPVKLRAAVGFVAAAHEYTLHMTPQFAAQGALSWEAFAGWVATQDRYSDVWEQMLDQDTVAFGPDLDIWSDLIAQEMAELGAEIVVPGTYGPEPAPSNYVIWESCPF